MEEIDVASILLDFIITASLYMVVPVIIFFNKKEDFTKKDARKYAIINSIVVFFVIIILFVIKDDGSTPRGTSAFVYGGINYWLLSKHAKKESDEYYIDKMQENQEEEELSNLINKLENKDK